jgi:hypothetical protein
VSAWLAGLARRAIDRRRVNRGRKPPLAEPPASAPVLDPAVELHQVQSASVVHTAIAGLTANERAAYQLAYFSDLSQSEVAKKLRIPLGNRKDRDAQRDDQAARDASRSARVATGRMTIRQSKTRSPRSTGQKQLDEGSYGDSACGYSRRGFGQPKGRQPPLGLPEPDQDSAVVALTESWAQC